MKPAVFVDLQNVSVSEKRTQLASVLSAYRATGEASSVFVLAKESFKAVPSTPFAYWASDAVRELFLRLDEFQKSGRHACVTNPAGDDSRYFRCFWEVAPGTVGEHSRWAPLAKGGDFSPFYSDVHLLVDWDPAAQSYRGFLGTVHRPLSRPASVDFFFRAGITYSTRTQRGFSARALPHGCIFHAKGPGIFVDVEQLPIFVALFNSEVFRYLLRLQIAFGSYEVGVLQRTPVPDMRGPAAARLALLGNEAIELKRSLDLVNEVAHVFRVPALLRSSSDALKALAVEWTARVEDVNAALGSVAVQINEISAHLYGVPNGDIDSVSRSDAGGGDGESVEGDDDADEATSWFAPVGASSLTADLVSWCLGSAFGRWDVRMARDATLLPALQGPFERLPRVAPGGLVGAEGLPATQHDIASEAWLRARPNVGALPLPDSISGSAAITAAEYLIPVAWDGVLVDDEGHERDIVRAVRRVLACVYGNRADTIEAEALELLRSADGSTPESLRDWFRSTKATALGKSFLDYHIGRYSKSRRKAPIYWRLAASANAPYAVWLYYPRLTKDTLWRVLGDYVGPRRALAERQLAELRPRREAAAGAERRKLDKEIDATAALLDSVTQLEQELRRVAERGYAPDLDDGVVISAAPLHRVFPWPEPAKVWKDLEAGKYDWAKLAMALWPERVREKCATDRSLAIAHGLA